MAGGDLPQLPHDEDCARLSSIKPSLSNSNHCQATLSILNPPITFPRSGHASPSRLTPQENGASSPKEVEQLTLASSYLEAAQRSSKNFMKQDILGVDFPLKPVTLVQGKPSISFNSVETSQLLADLKFILIGKFAHGRPPMSSIQKFFANLKLQGKFLLSLIDKKHISIECHSKADFYFLWLKLNWSIQGYSMRIFKWDSGFQPSKESPIAPVWIRISNLPLYFFEVKTLLSIANVIGSPILIDPKIVHRTDFSSASFCVELDVSKPLIDSIWINLIDESSRVLGGFWASVSYNVVPPYCLACSHIGHGQDTCKRLLEDAALPTTAVADADPKAVVDLAAATATSLLTEDIVCTSAAADKTVSQKELTGVPTANTVIDQHPQPAAVEHKMQEAGPSVVPQGAAETDTAAEVITVSQVQAPVSQVQAAKGNTVESQVQINSKNQLSFATAQVPSPSVQQVVGSSQPVANPITVHVSSKQNAIQHKLPQVWQKVNSKSPVKKQAETAPVNGKTLTTSNRFTIIAVPALTEALHTTPEEVSPRNVTTITTTPAPPAADIKQNAQIINAATSQDRTRRRTDTANDQQGNWVSAVRQNSVTTRAQARKLAPEQHNQQQLEKAPVRKAKEQM